MKENAKSHIDLKMGAKILSSDIGDAKKMVFIMLESLCNDREALESFYRDEKWNDLTWLVDKIRGGLFYCGTPHLQTITNQLYQSLKLSDIKAIKTHYSNFCNEVKAIEIAVKLMDGKNRCALGDGLLA